MSWSTEGRAGGPEGNFAPWRVRHTQPKLPARPHTGRRYCLAPVCLERPLRAGAAAARQQGRRPRGERGLSPLQPDANNAASSMSGRRCISHVEHSGLFRDPCTLAHKQTKLSPRPHTGRKHRLDLVSCQRPPRDGAAAARQQGRYPRGEYGAPCPAAASRSLSRYRPTCRSCRKQRSD